MPYNLPNPFLPKQSNKDQPLFVNQKPVLQQSRAEPILPEKESIWTNIKNLVKRDKNEETSKEKKLPLITRILPAKAVRTEEPTMQPEIRQELPAAIIEPAKAITNKISDDQRNKVIATIIGEGISEGEVGMQAILNNIISRAEKGYRGSNLFEVVSSGDGAQYNAFSVSDPNYKQTLDYLRGQRDASPAIKEATEFIKSLLERYDKGELEDLIGGNMNYLNPSITSERGKELSGFNKRDKSKDIVIGNHVFWSN